MEFSRQEYRSGLPFPSPVGPFCQNSLPWLVHLGWPYIAWRMTRLWSMWSVWLVFCDCGFHSVCPQMDKIRGLWKLPDGRDWLRGKLDLILMGGAMLSKSLIQFFVDGQDCVPSLLFDLRPNEDNGDLLQKVPGIHCHTQGSRPCTRPPLTHTYTRDSWTLKGKSGSVSCGVTAPFSWVLVHIRFCLCPPRVCFPSPVQVLVALWWG